MAKQKRQLSQVEDLIRAAEYVLRYERGHFRAGYCLVNERRMIVINKFFDVGARLQKLTELLAELDVDETLLSDEQKLLYQSLLAESA